MRVKLTVEQVDLLNDMYELIEHELLNDADSLQLARIKARCIQFLEYPLIQALKSEGL